MKKIIFIFIVSFVFVFNVNAYKFTIGEQVPNMYITRNISNSSGAKQHNGAPFMLKRSDGAIVYCIDAFQPNVLDKEYQEYNYNNSIFGLSDEQLEKINIISYYGYGYKNHSDIKWYGITQFLIWKTLNYNDLFFTNVYRGTRANVYVDEVNEIENLVNNHYLLPSISNNTYKYTINNSYEIIDNNNTLSNYEILESNIDAKILDNKLLINTKEEGNYEIKFINKKNTNKDYSLYYLEGSQSLISPGKVKDIEFKVNIEVMSGSITVNKLDSQGENREFATLEGAVYGVYKDNLLIDKIETNDIGVAYINNLPLGKYQVKEISPSKGYNIDENTYEIELSIDNKDIIINSYENIIKGDITFNKYYGDKDNYNKEDGAAFEIYDINNKLIGTYETKNGTINKKLDYGDYYAIQTKGKDGYNFVDKFNISVKENKEYKFDLYDDILVVEVPNTGKNDYYRLIPLILIMFGSLLVTSSIKNTTHFE